MKNLLYVGLLLLSISSCRKENPIGDTPVALHPLDILRSHDWKWGHDFQVFYYSSHNDTFDYMMYKDSCDMISRFSVGDSSSIIANGYQWLETNICTGATQGYSNFAIDTVQDETVVRWGQYTTVFKLDRLDDQVFSLFYTGIGQVGDSMRYYLEFVK